MVKLTGPGLAQKASGGLSDAVIFSSSKGRAYLKTNRKPKQPRTPSQVAMRTMMSFLSASFLRTPGADPTTWQPRAAAAAVSPFNAFNAYNLSRWRNKDSPTINYPENPSAITRSWSTPTTQTIGRFIRIAWQFTTLTNGWGVPIYRTSLPAQDGYWNQLIGLAYQVTTGVGHFDDLHPIVGLNRYAVSLISRNGLEIPVPWHIQHTFP